MVLVVRLLGLQTAEVRYRNLMESSVEVKIEEERSADRETFHLNVRIAYLVVEGTEDTSSGHTPLSELDRGRVVCDTELLLVSLRDPSPPQRLCIDRSSTKKEMD